MNKNHAAAEDFDSETGDDVKVRQRSTISFPYTDYENAIQVATAIHNNVGHGICNLPQLAAWIGSSVKSSSFRTLISAARLFGLIDSDNAESYRLTDLGTRIADPAQSSAAKAEAFMRVPLFAALFEKYKTGVTPPSPALEREIVSLGVSEKQKARARQVFESSAHQTGFRAHGANRLVMPAVVVPPASSGHVRSKVNGEDDDSGDGGANVELDLDPLLIALLKKIPSQGQPWPRDRRLRWFKTFAMNASEVYDADDDPVELNISDIAKHQQGGTS